MSPSPKVILDRDDPSLDYRLNSANTISIKHDRIGNHPIL